MYLSKGWYFHELCFHVSSGSSWLALIYCPLPLRGIPTLVTYGFSFSPQLLASSCPGLDRKMGGSRFHPTSPCDWLPWASGTGFLTQGSLAGHQQVSVNLPLYSEGKYFVGTNDVLIWLEHSFPNTYRGISLIALPPAPLTFV